MFKFFAKRYDKKIDAIGLAFFRVAFFIVFLCEILQMFYFKELMFDVIPFLQPHELSYDWAFYAWMICIVCLILGLFTRTMTIVNYMFTLVFISTSSTFEYHVFYTYTTINFFCLFLPIAKRFSLDNLLLKLKYSNSTYTYKPPTTTTVLSYTMPLFIAMAFVYSDSILYKVTSDFWMSGLGVWYPSSFPQASITSSSSLGGFLINNLFMTKFFGYLTVFFEFIFIFLFWFKRFRPFLLIVGVGLHMGIAITFPIPWFGLSAAACYILLVPLNWYGKIAAWFNNGKKLLTFYYDKECPLCARAKITVEHFDIFSTIAFKTVQGNQKDEAIEEIKLDALLDNIHSVDSNGKVYVGIDTYIQILLKMRYTVLFGLLLKIPGIYHIAKAIYNYVAANRNTERCSEDNCGYELPTIPQDKDQIKLLKNLTVRRVRIFWITLGLIGITLLQMGISYSSGAAYSAFTKIGLMDSHLGQTLLGWSKTINSNAKPLLGLTHHPVFMDNHFVNYRHIVSVSHVDKEGKKTRLPIIDEQGSPGYYIYGANWVHWTFRVNSPGRLVYPQLLLGVRDFTAFWAHKNNISTKDANFVLELKMIDMPTEFVPDLLEKQRAKPWEDFGKATWTNNQFKFEIDGKFQPLFQ